jgi:hypothetical protein
MASPEELLLRGGHERCYAADNDVEANHWRAGVKSTAPDKWYTKLLLLFLVRLKLVYQNVISNSAISSIGSWRPSGEIARVARQTEVEKDNKKIRPVNFVQTSPWPATVLSAPNSVTIPMS